MRITFVLDTFGGGGKERRCLQLIQGLNKEGYNNIQVIIINNDIAYQEIYDADIELHIIDRKNKGLNTFKTLRILHKLFKDFKPDIVQVWGLFSAFFTNIIRLFTPLKFIGSYVADCNKPKLFSIAKITVLLNILLADYIIGNSKEGLKTYGIPENKAKVIYNGFNEKRYDNQFVMDKLQVRNNLNITNKFVIPMIARVDDNKDQKTFIDAAKSILKDRNDIDFLIVGKGHNLEKLKIMITQKESKHIHFLGFRTDVENIIKISTLTVLCTNPLLHKEGVSNAILESLAFGVPVIATNDGGTPEIIDSGINGYLIDAFNSNELKEKITEILDNEELHLRLSENAISTVKDKFTLNKMTNSYIELYKNLYLK